MAKPASRKETIVIGTIAALAGTYFMVVGSGLVPVPGGPRNLHAPLWVVFCAGLAFFLGGAAVVTQGIGRANASGHLPVDAPAWIRIAIDAVGVVIFACFALIATWIAFGGGPRRFSGTIAGVSGGVGAGIGRVAFGIAAVVMWVCTIGFARAAWKKLRIRTPP